MNIAIDINNYSIDNVYFGESIKNAIIDNGKFMRIFYSNDIMTLNGIYFKIDMDLKKINDSDIENLFSTVRNIENSILDKICIKNKIKVIKIFDHLMINTNANNQNGITNMNGNATINNTNTNNKYTLNFSKIHNLNKMLLKISGVWETTNEYGLTFKFIEINRQ